MLLAFAVPASCQAQPDVQAKTATGDFVGAGVYGPGQGVSDSVNAGGSLAYDVRIQNSSGTDGSFLVTGSPGNADYQVQYSDPANEDITAAMTGDTGYLLSEAAEETVDLCVRVTALAATDTAPAPLALTVTAVNTRDFTINDTVTLTTTTLLPDAGNTTSTAPALPGVRPDLQIERPDNTNWLGAGIFESVPDDAQTRIYYTAADTPIISFQRVVNAGDTSGNVRITGTPQASANWSIAYLDANGNDVSAQVFGTGWVVSLAPGAEVDFSVQVTPIGTGGSQRSVNVTTSVASVDNPAYCDALLADVAVTSGTEATLTQGGAITPIAVSPLGMGHTPDIVGSSGGVMTPASPPPAIRPPWAEGCEPMDGAVKLATGDLDYTTTDITVGNPKGGPSVSFSRRFSSNLVAGAYSSPGLSPGWTHSYDITLQNNSGILTLTYQNGAEDTLTPNGYATDGSVQYSITTLNMPEGYTGAPYIAESDNFSTPCYINLIYRDRTTWCFEQCDPGGGGAYYPVSITDGISRRSITLNWEYVSVPGMLHCVTRLHSIGTDSCCCCDGDLLELTYDGTSGALTSAIDEVLSRTVAYDTVSGQLTAVSQPTYLAGGALTSAPLREAYTYIAPGASPLNTISRPDPSRPETTPPPSRATTPVTTITYSYPTGTSVTCTDPEGNDTTYSGIPGAGNAGTVTVTTYTGSATAAAPLYTWTQKVDSQGRDVGKYDSANIGTTITYADPMTPGSFTSIVGSAHPWLPQIVTAADGTTTTYVYDAYANTIQVTDARVVITVQNYVPDSAGLFPWGLLGTTTEQRPGAPRPVMRSNITYVPDTCKPYIVSTYLVGTTDDTTDPNNIDQDAVASDNTAVASGVVTLPLNYAANLKADYCGVGNAIWFGLVAVAGSGTVSSATLSTSSGSSIATSGYELIPATATLPANWIAETTPAIATSGTFALLHFTVPSGFLDNVPLTLNVTFSASSIPLVVRAVMLKSPPSATMTSTASAEFCRRLGTQVVPVTTTTYTYETCGDGVGEVETVTSTGDTPGSTTTESYTYDSCKSGVDWLPWTVTTATGGVTSDITTYQYDSCTAQETYAEYQVLSKFNDDGTPRTTPVLLVGRKVTHTYYDCNTAGTGTWEHCLSEVKEETLNDSGVWVTSITDYPSYDVVGAPLTVLEPWINTGVLRGKEVTSYVYPGGPVMVEDTYKEGYANDSDIANVTTTTYGAAGETMSTTTVTAVTPPTIPATFTTTSSSCTYDALYRTKSETESGQATLYEYNGVGGRPSKITYPNGSTVLYQAYDSAMNLHSYDSAGRLTGMTDRNGNMKIFTYTPTPTYFTDPPAGLLNSITYTSPLNTAYNVTYTYNNLGQLTSRMDHAGTETITYTDDGRIESDATQYKDPNGVLLLANQTTLHYHYNSDGSRDYMDTPAGRVGYGYDDDGRLASSSSAICPAAIDTLWTYKASGALESQSSSNGWLLWLDYDAQGRATSREYLDSLSNYTEVAGWGTQYDANGHIARIDEDTWGYWKYLYDNQGELTDEQFSTTGGPVSNYEYSMGYDSQGNLLRFNHTVGSGVNQHELPGYASSTYNRNYVNGSTTNPGYGNQWKGYVDSTPTVYIASSFIYDSAGNPTVYKGDALTYDPNNKLTSYTPNGGTTTLTADYRADGLRAWKQTGTRRTYFLYDGTTPVVELSQTLAAGTWSTPIVSAVNLFGPDGLYERDISTDGTNFTPVVYAFDALSNVALRQQGTDTATDQAYDAWGMQVYSTTTVNDPWGYKAQYGYYTDQETGTGLILCGQRYYDPMAGRWLTEDPIGEEGGANAYAYCGGDPIGNIDPSGLLKCVLIVGEGFKCREDNVWGDQGDHWFSNCAQTWCNNNPGNEIYVIYCGDSYKSFTGLIASGDHGIMIKSDVNEVMYSLNWIGTHGSKIDILVFFGHCMQGGSELGAFLAPGQNLVADELPQWRPDWFSSDAIIKLNGCWTSKTDIVDDDGNKYDSAAQKLANQINVGVGGWTGCIDPVTDRHGNWVDIKPQASGEVSKYIVCYPN